MVALVLQTLSRGHLAACSPSHTCPSSEEEAYEAGEGDEDEEDDWEDVDEDEGEDEDQGGDEGAAAAAAAAAPAPKGRKAVAAAKRAAKMMDQVGGGGVCWATQSETLLYVCVCGKQILIAHSNAERRC